MPTLNNSLEGGADGATITTGNSGGASGDAFGAATVDAGASLIYTTAHAAHGSVGAQVSTGVGSGSAYVAWTSGLPATSPTVWARAYYRFAANPAATVNVLRILSGSNGIMGTIRVNAAGTIGMLYGSGTLAGTSAAALTAGSWFRVETSVTAGSTTGAMSCRIFWSSDSETPDQTLSIANVNAGAVNPSRLRVGVVSNLAGVSPFQFDDLSLSDVTWPGPAGAAPPPPLFHGWGVPI
ncbi:hypothetical protein [Streptosporangium sp. NPDC002524]|uniref:hypothetical protein n=1 Tax=Streptosporangium sp. NPDC002524 TaxID=3154537 RepID=UPI00332BDC9C